MNNGNHQVVWEHRQAELWDRIFQATQDVVAFAEALRVNTGTRLVQEELVRAAMRIGSELVRANAADERTAFLHSVQEARLKAIETDYWLRMAYTIQQREELQRDISGLLNQYAAIIDLLQTFTHHIEREPDVIARHTKGPRVT